MTPELRTALGAKAAFLAVERRLADAGAFNDLEVLHRLSADEVDVLTAQERGLWQVGDL